ncbi:MAG: hypothetical protein R3233_04365, partial [Xanthomonadales bacterium]|nr:hypothetical protein [Xanthomonadales bacterium]
MKAQAIDTLPRKRTAADWRPSPPAVAAGLLAQARGLEIVAMLAIVIGAVLAVSTPGMEAYLQAVLWAGGFLFYGRAFDSERPSVAALLVATGAAIQALAWMSDRMAPELAVVAATLVAAWVAAVIAAAVFRRT